MTTEIVRTPVFLRPLKPLADFVAMIRRDVYSVFERDPAARSRLELGAPPGDSAALFVYPEFTIRRIVLRTPTDIDTDTGQVLATTEKNVFFPMVAAVHFCVTVTGQDVRPGDDSIDGMKIKTRKRTPLFPVQLVEIKHGRPADQTEARRVANGN